MKKFNIRMIISGGQTGVDRAALDFALESGIPCTGWCPRSRRAEDGQIPEKYPVKETSSVHYQHRTRLNVKDSDATLIITDGSSSRGTDLTAGIAAQYSRPLFKISENNEKSLKMLVSWLNKHSPVVLNVAGPRGSEGSDVYKLAFAILKKVLKKSEKPAPDWPPEKPTTPDLPAFKN
ncbi:MAG: putative molybdenum carrier protein [Candidatus Rifleibacteriota bacterium]